MGLSNPRKRAKFSQDPNNTAWSRSSARFGEKLLLSQGWTPGSPLGANCAPYINIPASVSHIRTSLKDNNLGLGAKNGAHGDDSFTTGLDGLQNLLGRLNGKNEEALEKEHRSRADSRRTIYSERRWGFGNFISGGYLIGDRNHLENAENCKTSDPAPETCDMIARSGMTSRGSEKEKVKSKRRSKKEPSRNSNGMAPRLRSTASSSEERVMDKKDVRHTKRSRVADGHTLELQKRIQKQERKAQRRAHKAEKLAAEPLKHEGPRPPDLLPPPNKSKKQEPAVETASARHAVRQRFIQHKKMSLMDQRALNEILMIKAEL